MSYAFPAMCLSYIVPFTRFVHFLSDQFQYYFGFKDHKTTSFEAMMFDNEDESHLKIFFLTPNQNEI